MSATPTSPQPASSSLKEPHTMDNSNTATPVLNGSFDLSAMRLPTSYGEALDVRKVLTSIPVGKPSKGTFFRVREGEGWEFPVLTVQDPGSSETYIVQPEVAPSLGGLCRPVQLHAAIDRHGNEFLLPVPLPGSDGRRNRWHESLNQAAQLAKKQWVRIGANMPAGSYDVLVAQGNLPEPAWPETTLEDLIRLGFHGKVIDSVSHPVVQGALGLV